MGIFKVWLMLEDGTAGNEGPFTTPEDAIVAAMKAVCRLPVKKIEVVELKHANFRGKGDIQAWLWSYDKESGVAPPGKIASSGVARGATIAGTLGAALGGIFGALGGTLAADVARSKQLYELHKRATVAFRAWCESEGIPLPVENPANSD